MRPAKKFEYDDFGVMLAIMIHYAQFPEVTLTKKQFDELGEYSCTIPTGVKSGKQWKRNDYAHGGFPGYEHPCWLLGEYVKSPVVKDACDIKWSRIVVTS